jgi:uncharacterized BrkB/YihY/UPF0761 family membrane protein
MFRRTRAAASGARARAEKGRERLEAARPRVTTIDAGFELYERDRLAAGGILAGALAYRFFITLLPVTLLLVVGLGYASAANETAPAEAAQEFGIGGAAATSVAESARASSGGRALAATVGVVALLYSALTAVRALRITHAIAWQLPERRWRGNVAATLAYVAIVLLAFGVSSATGWAREHLGVAGLAVTIASLAAFFAIWLWASWRLPHGPVGWTALVPGAILMAVGVLGLQLVTFLYVSPRLDSATATYGALGVALVLLLWLYLLARLVVAAAMLNATLWERQQHRSFQP